MGTSRAPVEILERARRGGDLEPGDIGALARYWVEGIATDTQMAAWCASPGAAAAGSGVARAICRALLASGRRLDPGSLGPTADTHSSGGVGDAISLIAVPLAAALGATVLKLSGEGREHYGGSLDKLASVPGMTTALDARGLLRAARDGGAAVAGGPAAPAPAVGRLEALLGAIGGAGAPVVVAAMCAARAIATGVGGTAIRMTFGTGGTFADRADAVRAASMAAEVVAATGRTARTGVSPADEPVGPAVGNALEIAAAADVLRGEARGRLGTAACSVAGAMAEAAGAAPPGEGVRSAERALADGSALEAAERWVAGQGGDPAVWTDARRRATAPLVIPVGAIRDGVLARTDARVIGLAARGLGAGRLHPSQGVDYAVGVELLAGVGDAVSAGETVARVHARDSGLGERAAAEVGAAITLGDEPAEAARGPIEWLTVIDA